LRSAALAGGPGGAVDVAVVVVVEVTDKVAVSVGASTITISVVVVTTGAAGVSAGDSDGAGVEATVVNPVVVTCVVEEDSGPVAEGVPPQEARHTSMISVRSVTIKRNTDFGIIDLV
jgi:hypothetical protein